MINQDFCTHLEFILSKAFSVLDNPLLKHFWCDGILLPLSDKEISKEYINRNRQISMTTFIGVNGQDRYSLILKFGNKSLSRYIRGLDLKECIPEATSSDWLEIDTDKKVLKVQLL